MNIFFKMCVMNIYGDCVLFTGVQTTDEEMLEISPCELVSLNIQFILLGQLSFSIHGYWLIAMASIVKPVLQGLMETSTSDLGGGVRQAMTCTTGLRTPR
jgi:hypothetical protein